MQGECREFILCRAAAKFSAKFEKFCGNSQNLKNFAEIAQLVEHDLAKVGVASSSLVFRSREVIRNGDLFSYISMCCSALVTALPFRDHQ